MQAQTSISSTVLLNPLKKLEKRNGRYRASEGTKGPGGPSSSPGEVDSGFGGPFFQKDNFWKQGFINESQECSDHKG
ncbi:unnamed protein product [Strongylus vulgaris]|uniref:Uncharacterized protein n=1 Tax=Strongylus vulgaris TaxID=40348 RepID=A0A3P7L693_STRVU|nr:unnamed protein product [Strongylus vulgaris]